MTDKKMEKISKQMCKLIHSEPEEEWADITLFITVEAVITGARDTFQGVGILDVAKKQYLDLAVQVAEEETYGPDPDRS